MSKPGAPPYSASPERSVLTLLDAVSSERALQASKESKIQDGQVTARSVRRALLTSTLFAEFNSGSLFRVI